MERMQRRASTYDTTYSNFANNVMAAVRRETFGEDIGQNSWLTITELRTFVDWLGLKPGQHVLDVGSGSGGPSLYLAGLAACRLTGIDNSESAVATASQAAETRTPKVQAQFRTADATQTLPFAPDMFDAVICIDSMNHFVDRLAVLRELYRVLKPGGRILYTDPIVVTGPISSEEITVRSSAGFSLFVPPGENERLLQQSHFFLVRREDVSENEAVVSNRWHIAHDRRRNDLIKMEGDSYDMQQRFFAVVHRLASQGRLSRFAYVGEKLGAEQQVATSPLGTTRPYRGLSMVV